jgi:glycosyltransferase involved in cell wall biosynthesis
MHLLFVHQAFPAQFGRLALELARRYGWRCSFLIQHLSKCPTPDPEMLEGLTVIAVPRPRGSAAPPPWNEALGDYLALSARVFEAARARPELRPDLLVSHCGLGPSLFLPDLYRCPLVNYCEYYLAVRRRDLTYRVDLPPVELAPFYPRCVNAATLLGLTGSPLGYTPTRWQRQSFPARFRPGIEVLFDGLDTDLYRPRSPRPDLAALLGGSPLPADTRLVTYVARGLESMRGFDLFLRVAGRIARARPDVLFLVVGGDESYYGWDQHFTALGTFRQWALARGEHDPARLVFLGQVEPAQLALVLARSDLHLYLTVPFVLSWSLYNALACGAVVLASDVEPVREVVEAEVTGLVEPLFDVERLADTALRVLKDPGAHRPLGEAARRTMLECYGLEVAVPALRDYFERRAAGAGG